MKSHEESKRPNGIVIDLWWGSDQGESVAIYVERKDGKEANFKSVEKILKKYVKANEEDYSVEGFIDVLCDEGYYVLSGMEQVQF